MRIDRDTYADFMLTDDEYIAQIVRGITSQSSGRGRQRDFSARGPGDDEFDEDYDDFEDEFDDEFDDDEDDDWEDD